MMEGDTRLQHLLREAAGRCGADGRLWRHFLNGLGAPVRRALLESWRWQAHGGQAAPSGDWTVWLIMAGRGFGKTRAGAEWVHEVVRSFDTGLRQAQSLLRMSGEELRIALVGATRDDAVRVMVEGPSGLIATARSDEPVEWKPSVGMLTFAGGAQAFVYSAGAPESLRGPEHHFAWVDELAKWSADWRGPGPSRGERAWDNLMMGLRLGVRPRAVVTTTPKSGPLLKRVRALTGCVETRGRTRDNVHLPGAFLEWAEATYGGTRLGRQELEGELFEDVEGALFARDVLERARVLRYGPSTSSVPTQDERFVRIVIGVDPPASVGGTCGIVVAGCGAAGLIYVLADASVSGASPERWARSVAMAAGAWGADRVIAEKNQGGDMVENVLRGANVMLPVRLVSASRGKVARAEPVAALFEAGKAKLAGHFRELEDELAGLQAGGGYAGPGRSPDRADAMVWALTSLMKRSAPPRIAAL